jgi:hypothetical protein
MSQIDVLQLILGTQASLQYQRQAESGANGQPVLPLLLNSSSMAIMKGQAGWPADINTFDQTMIRQSVTEIDTSAANWSNPAYNKKFISKTWSPDGGIAWLPRFFTSGGPAWMAITPDTSYVEYENGVAQPVKNVGLSAVLLEGPFNDQDFGGVVGSASYYLHSYYYNNGSTREQNFYVPGLSLVQWHIQAFVDGAFAAPSNVSLFNTLQPGPMPALAYKL